jgi:glycosyltransferase involved in cell wall biosynthesis
MPYLKEAMESLLSQTMQDFDILAVVQDCDDGSVEFMESIRDPRLRIIRKKERGLVAALNQMLREVTTPWLVRQDTDDVSYPNRLERIQEWITRAPDAGMFYSLAEYYPKDQCVGQFRCTRGTPEELRRVAESGYLLSFCHPSVVLNAAKALAIGGYNPALYIEDVEMWGRMALNYKIQFIPEVLIGYRQNAGSLTAQSLLRSHLGGLYDQYLLLSQLHGWEPQPLEQVSDLLSSLVSTRELRAKEKLRELNMRLAQKKLLAAVTAALQSFLTSPSYFLKRLAEEFRQAKPITNGVNPQMYLQRKAEFWP